MTRLSSGMAAMAAFTSVSDRVEFLGIGGGVGLVAIATRRVGRAEGVHDVFHIDLRIGDRLEGMRVDVAMLLASRPASSAAFGIGRAPCFMLIGSTPLVSSTMAALVALASTRRCQEAFEMQPVDQNHIGAGHRDGIGRFRLIDMRVAVRADQRGQFDPVAADILGEIADDGEAGDDLQLLGGG